MQRAVAKAFVKTGTTGTQEEKTVKARDRDIREVQVSDWWRSGAIRTVLTTEGRSLRVLYPGRPSPHAGPDFLDTVLITEGGELVRGDTEVHLRRRDWDGHGHRGDPRYNGVVLHLFLRGGGASPKPSARVQEALLNREAVGLAVPVSAEEGPGPKLTATPLEHMAAMSPEELGESLDEAGERRFLAMACAFAKSVRSGDALEELYAGIMEALGYSQNSAPMGLLARGLPLRLLRELAGPAGDPAAVEAILLGAGGFFQRQLSLDPAAQGERESRDLRMEEMWLESGKPVAVPGGMWSRAGLRPQNRPERRLAGAAALIERFGFTGLLDGLRSALAEGGAGLEKALVAEDCRGIAPGPEGNLPRARLPALIGRSRAREVGINVVLPFFYGRAHLMGDLPLAGKCLELFRSMPPGQENEVTREMKCILGDSRERRIRANTARRQQGLIHLYQVLKGQAR